MWKFKFVLWEYYYSEWTTKPAKCVVSCCLVTSKACSALIPRVVKYLSASVCLCVWEENHVRASSLFLPSGECVDGRLVSVCLALQLSLHTQWVGVASLMIENKHSSSQTSDISCLCDKSLSCHPSVCLAWVAWQTTTSPSVSHELLQRRLIFLPPCFSETAR